MSPAVERALGHRSGFFASRELVSPTPGDFIESTISASDGEGCGRILLAVPPEAEDTRPTPLCHTRVVSHVESWVGKGCSNRRKFVPRSRIPLPVAACSIAMLPAGPRSSLWSQEACCQNSLGENGGGLPSCRQVSIEFASIDRTAVVGSVGVRAPVSVSSRPRMRTPPRQTGVVAARRSVSHCKRAGRAPVADSYSRR